MCDWHLWRFRIYRASSGARWRLMWRIMGVWPDLYRTLLGHVPDTVECPRCHKMGYVSAWWSIRLVRCAECHGNGWVNNPSA